MTAAAAKILRPFDVAKVDPFAAFVADAATLEVARGVAARHWPGAVIESGDAGAAANWLAEGRAPELLLVDLADSADAAMDAVELLRLCTETTRLVAIGNVNDCGLYRDLMREGVADYLVKPLDAETLEAALFGAMRQTDTVSGPTMDGRVIAVVGARGGVGASTVAVNGAWTMAQQTKEPVALIDLDLQFGTAALALDFAPSHGLCEALQNPSRIDGLFVASAMVQAGGSLSVLAAEENLARDLVFDSAALERLIKELRADFPWIWIDLPRSSLHRNLAALLTAAEILIVSDLSLVAVRDVIRLRAHCDEVNGSARQRVIANRDGVGKAGKLRRDEFASAIETDIDLVLPEDSTVAAALAAGKALPDFARRSKFGGALAGLCQDLSGRLPPKRGLAGFGWRKRGAGAS